VKKIHGFAYIAFWQFMTFVALVLLVWVNELLDLPALLYAAPPREPDVFSGWVLSAGVLIIAIITVGHTYVQQKKIISGMLTVCSYCHKIRIEKRTWEQMEDYLADHSLAALSHGVCPECFERITSDRGDGAKDS
jgi:hypothetical protein